MCSLNVTKASKLVVIYLKFNGISLFSKMCFISEATLLHPQSAKSRGFSPGTLVSSHRDS